MGILEKLANRNAYPEKLRNGEQIHVRALSLDQLDRIDKLEPNLKTGFLIGCCLCTERGVPEIQQDKGEEDAKFSERVLTDVKAVGMGTDTLREIQQAIGRIGRADVEELAKN